MLWSPATQLKCIKNPWFNALTTQYCIETLSGLQEPQRFVRGEDRIQQGLKNLAFRCHFDPLDFLVKTYINTG